MSSTRDLVLQSQKELVRQSQVLEVFQLLRNNEVASEKDACDMVGINVRTYQRWKDIALQELQLEIAQQRKMIATQLVDAEVGVVQELLEALVGEKKVKPQYWVSYFDRYWSLKEQVVPDVQPDDEMVAWSQDTEAAQLC